MYFVSRTEFERLKEDGAFLESVQYGANYYGTSAAAVGAVIDEQRKVCLIDINLSCVFELCKCPFHLPPLTIFLEPPSMEVTIIILLMIIFD